MTLRQWDRPAYLDEWGPPPFKNEEYLFRQPMLQKHFDAMTWAGIQIALLTQAALDTLEETGISAEEAAERLKERLRDGRRIEGKKFVEENNIPPEQRDARLIGHLIMKWEAALGVSRRNHDQHADAVPAPLLRRQALERSPLGL